MHLCLNTSKIESRRLLAFLDYTDYLQFCVRLSWVLSLFGTAVVIACLTWLLSFWRMGVQTLGYVICLNLEAKKVIHSSGQCRRFQVYLENKESHYKTVTVLYKRAKHCHEFIIITLIYYT